MARALGLGRTQRRWSRAPAPEPNPESQCDVNRLVVVPPPSPEQVAQDDTVVVLVGILRVHPRRRDRHNLRFCEQPNDAPWLAAGVGCRAAIDDMA